MDTTKLVVGQDVYMRSGLVGGWAEVVEVASEGVTVESDPAYGSELIRFDVNGEACDRSDIGSSYGGNGPWKLYLDISDFITRLDTTGYSSAKEAAVAKMAEMTRNHKMKMMMRNHKGEK